MDWIASRVRLGAELIGARQAIALRFRELLAEQGRVVQSLDRAAAELVLHAGAALSEGAPPETPWARCGGVLLVDAREGAGPTCAELVALWAAIEWQLARVTFTEQEERQALEQVGLQLTAALRGAEAEAAELLRDAPVAEPGLRFGGVRLVRFGGRDLLGATQAA